MARQMNWMSVACNIMLFVWTIIIFSYIAVYFHDNAIQSAHHECKSKTTRCDPNAQCYGNDTSYVCMCISGWNGDGFVGDGHSGCHRRQVSKSWQIVFGIAASFSGLVILWYLVVTIWTCICWIRSRARVQNSSPEALARGANRRQGLAFNPLERV